MGLTEHSYFDAARRLHSRCELQTTDAIPKLGKAVPKTLATFDQYLRQLERFGCCADWCPGAGTPHLGQRMGARVVSHSLAAVRLIFMGHYDEALILARNMGETANLALLFAAAPAEHARWQSLPDNKRWPAFRPKAVRAKLKAAGSPILVEEHAYGLLSAFVHHRPDSKPQAFNPIDLPTVGGYLQVPGLMIGLNETAFAAGAVGIALAALAGPPKGIRRALSKRARALLGAVGSVRLQDLATALSSASASAG